MPSASLILDIIDLKSFKFCEKRRNLDLCDQNTVQEILVLVDN